MAYPEHYEAAEELATNLLDLDYTPDTLQDAVRSDEEFLYLARAHKALDLAAEEQRDPDATDAQQDRVSKTEEAQYCTDEAAIERLEELCQEYEIEHRGPCAVVESREVA